MLEVGSRRRFVPAVIVALVFGLSAGCSQETQDRIDSIYDLKRDPTPENIEQIRTFLSDDDPDVRSTALFALVTLSVPDAKELAVQGLDDPAGFVRQTAAVLVGDFEDPALVGPLADRLLDDEDWHVRWRAAESLARIGGAESVAALVQGMSDPLKEVRRASVSGVAKLDPVGHVAELERLVGVDPEWEIRVQAARGLGRAGDPAGREVLQAALSDPNEFVRAAAAHALSTLDRGEGPRGPE